MWKDIVIAKHKSLEIQLEFFYHKDNNLGVHPIKLFPCWFDFNFGWSRQCDHAGPSLTIQLLWLYFCIKIYDHRHWDWDKGGYYGPEKGEA